MCSTGTAGTQGRDKSRHGRESCCTTHPIDAPMSPYTGFSGTAPQGPSSVCYVVSIRAAITCGEGSRTPPVALLTIHHTLARTLPPCGSQGSSIPLPYQKPALHAIRTVRIACTLQAHEVKAFVRSACLSQHLVSHGDPTGCCTTHLIIRPVTEESTAQSRKCDNTTLSLRLTTLPVEDP